VIARGFRDWKRLRQDPLFQPLPQDRGFRTLLVDLAVIGDPFAPAAAP